VFTSNEAEIWKFIDKGFDKTKDLAVASVNINNYPAEVRSATIFEADLVAGGAETEFYLANDDGKWIKAELGKELVFPDSHGRQLRWRAVFKPDSDPNTSIFFDRIFIGYKVKFL
jgi:hypothetical protein